MGSSEPSYPPNQTSIRWVRFVGGNPFEPQRNYFYEATWINICAGGWSGLGHQTGRRRLGGNPFALCCGLNIFMRQLESIFGWWTDVLGTKLAGRALGATLLRFAAGWIFLWGNLNQYSAGGRTFWVVFRANGLRPGDWGRVFAGAPAYCHPRLRIGGCWAMPVTSVWWIAPCFSYTFCSSPLLRRCSQRSFGGGHHFLVSYLHALLPR